LADAATGVINATPQLASTAATSNRIRTPTHGPRLSARI
jgi:hypothetical protein